jgi:hypothetical protein
VRGDAGVHGDDDARGFVAEDVCVGDDHGADAAGVPEVDVGAAIILSWLVGMERGGGVCLGDGR